MSSISDGLASFSSTDFTPDRLIVNVTQLVTRKITLLSGQNVARGAILGKSTVGAATAAAKSGGNAANTGLLTMDATTPVKAGAKVGVYTARFAVAASNNGTFIVKDPDGFQIGTIVMAAGTGTFDDDIKFAIADGTQDFIVGEGFDITVAAGSGKYVLSLAAAADGSQVPDCIAAHSIDATGGDKEELGYFRGQFSSNAVILGTGHTVASIREGLRVKGVDLIDVLAA